MSDPIIKIEPAGRGYRFDIDPRWWVVRGPHGGYLAGHLLRAMELEIDDPALPPRAMTTHFLAAPKEGIVDVAVAVERRGRTLTSVSARATQGDDVVALALAAFSGSFSGFDFDDSSAPRVPPPEEGFPIPHTDATPPFLKNFDMRWVIGGLPFSGAEAAEVGGWMRTERRAVADAAIVAILMDAWAPAVFPRADRPIVAPTIDLTIHFRCELPVPGATEEDFYLGRFGSTLGRDGFFEEDGALWTAEGMLIAQSRQLALALTPTDKS